MNLPIYHIINLSKTPHQSLNKQVLDKTYSLEPKELGFIPLEDFKEMWMLLCEIFQEIQEFQATHTTR
jgi:hypothetical protein